jgi:uncharacterized damage-inducible protein DinB
MRESIEQYVARVESYLGTDDPLDVMRSTPSALRRAVRGAPKRRLAEPPAPGKWSAAEILAHLVDTDLLWGYRIRKILETTGSRLDGVEQDRWCRKLRYAAVPPPASLAAFEALRRWNLALLGRLPPARLRAWGAHSQFGKLTVARILRLLAGHDRNHLRQVRVIARRPTPRGPGFPTA